MNDKMLEVCDKAIYTMGKIMAIPEYCFFIRTREGKYHAINPGNADNYIASGDTILECIENAEKENWGNGYPTN